MQENKQYFSPIKKRILQYLDYKGISKYKFYQDSGMTRGVLDKESGISEDNTAKFIAFAPEINPTWLLTGSGNMLLNEKSSSLVTEPISNYGLKTDNSLTQQMIPVYDMQATAGIIQLFDDIQNQKPVDYIHLPNAPKSDGAIQVVGDSMYPILKSGDLVAYKIIHNINRTNIFWGNMYIITMELDGEYYTTVKYVQKSDDKDFVTLISHNKNHNDKEIHLSSIRALAMIKASVRYHSLS